MLSPPFYVISDTHFCHDNIVGFCGRDKQLAAMIGEDTAQRIDHNDYMVQKWNETVSDDDVILHLGDLAFGKNPYRAIPYIEKLKGRKSIVLGNHDDPEQFDYEELGFTVIDPFEIEYRGWKVSFNHYPEDPGVLHRGGKHVRVHGHIHNNGYPAGSGKKGWRLGTTTVSSCHINVSVEEIDYTPQPVARLLDKFIDER